ncbi:Histone RNA hairpin-binding protein [Phytophthora citrophthora]|uniref:Histone RNA hairpin-binding protein n=1 Tax=Phytophthora citrophthora TaxID=4793 RepID=A0AAD9GWN2_9STRA|nr:Histone RNA hairpin-binding protein [Phytophthora citrophthora]
MKRSADVMATDGGEARGYRNSNHDRERPNYKRMRHGDGSSTDGNSSRGSCITKNPTVKTLANEKETDPHRLAQRQKQIDYGKNTIGYDLYCAKVPRHQRRPRKHPMTPDKTMRIGKKGFDAIIRKWRQALHEYDPPELAQVVKTENSAATATCAAATTEKGAGATTTSLSTSTTSTEPEVQKKEEAQTPSRSIYENFDEDTFDGDDDSDDDLL